MPGRGGAQPLAGAFAELSSQALAKNNEQFLALAATRLSEVRTAAEGDLTQRQQAIAQLLDPLTETLARYELALRDVELERKGAYEGRSEKLASFTGTRAAPAETRNLVTALRSPQTRAVGGRSSCAVASRWRGCPSTATSTSRGRRRPRTVVRPDMIVHMPGGGTWSSIEGPAGCLS